jgi:methyl-accepting chemotaxis protein
MGTAEKKESQKKAVFWGLRNKVLVPAVLITVLTGVLLTFEMTSKMKAIIYQDQETRGLGICNSLVFDVTQNVLKAKEAMAREFLLDYKTSHGLPYVFVLDGDGHIVANTFEGAVPAAVLNLIQGEKDKLGLQKKVIQLEGKNLIDIGANIVDAPGSVHIGMDLSQAEQQVNQITVNALVTVLVILLAGAALLWVVMSRMIKPIQALTGVVRKIVGEGDLTQKIGIKSGDEIGQLAVLFNEMVERQKTVYQGLTNTVIMLNETVRDMEALSEAQNQSVTIQATALQETQVTAQEIKQTSQMAAKKAEEILKLAEKADEIGMTGEASVEQSLIGLTDIRHQVQEIAQKIAELTDRTRQIGSITDTVKDLADQSNMLALNAAIEAVRSGEHGKGFGLVAREIRRLADQSIQSTGRVKEILDNISEAIEQVFQITESGSKRMEGGYAQVKVSGENLRALAGVVRENSTSVRQIATAVEQQNVGISQIFGAVTDQTKMMAESVKHVETTAGMVKVLKDASERLTKAMGNYKV